MLLFIFYAWFNLRNVYYLGKDDFDTGLEYWDRALEIELDNVDVLYNLANVYRKLGSFEKTIEAIQKVLEIDLDLIEVKYFLDTIKNVQEEE